MGTWASKDVCDYYININDFSSLKKNKFNEKFFTDDGLIIRLSDERCEFGIIGDSNPWKINKFEINKQTITLHCNRILYNYDNNNFNSSISDDSEKILIKIVDNDEIIFDDFSYPKETHFYRISGPAKISIRNAVINDNKVRIRIKPNLKCDYAKPFVQTLFSKNNELSSHRFCLQSVCYQTCFVNFIRSFVAQPLMNPFTIEELYKFPETFSQFICT